MPSNTYSEIAGRSLKLERLYGTDSWIHEWERRPVRIPRPTGFLVAEPRPVLWSGEWTLYYVRKISIPTHTTGRMLAKALGARSFAYYGLKDANAVAFQHIAVLMPLARPNHVRVGKKLEAWLVANGVAKPVPGLHAWNSFRIVVEPYSPDVPCRSGYTFPNYYGPQRFGTCKPTSHLVGLHLARELSGQAPGRVHGFSRRISLGALQAFTWNRALSLLLAEQEPGLDTGISVGISCPRHARQQRAPALPLPGRRRLGPRRWDDVIDLVLDEMGLSRRNLVGMKQHPRPAILRPCISRCERAGDRLVHLFVLPRGAYATVYLREAYLVDWLSECRSR